MYAIVLMIIRLNSQCSPNVLKAQRIIQDYQIVPRAIISSHRDARDKVLEQTLSMGHKIQQLSYNPAQDSVDVIQYYANFAGTFH